MVYSIDGKDRELWLGRQRGGLTRLRFERGSFTTKTYTQADGLAQNSVYSVYRSRDGSVWAGTLSGGVSRLSGGKFTTYTIANGLSSNTIASILESSDGTMWFATPSGLNALSQGRWRIYSARDGLPWENVNCLLEDSSRVLWIGSTAGLAFRDAGRFRIPIGAPTVPAGTDTGSGGRQLWMAVDYHLESCPAGEARQVITGRAHRGRYTRIRTCGRTAWRRRRQAASVRGHRQVRTNLVFLESWNFSVVDPRQTRREAPRRRHRARADAFGRWALRESTLEGFPFHFSGRRRRVTFRYAGLSLSVPERVRFRYQVEGFDHGWSDPVATREAVYTNLPPGSYRSRGYREQSPTGFGAVTKLRSKILKVDPLFWQTWWFRASVIMSFAIGFGAVPYRFRLHQVTRRLRDRFEERLAERTRIAQELHDTLLQGFLSASMQVHVVADRLPPESDVKPILTRALQLMGQVIDEGRNAVRGLRSHQTASLDLEQAFSRIQGELLAEGVAFRVIVDGERKRLHPVLRDEVYRIGREALLNAFRHARAKSIEIELRYSASHLRLFVRDDGCGMDPQIINSGQDGHWGLLGMRERADRIGARFHVFSNVKAGTEIELSIPGNIAFVDQSPGKLRWFGNGQSKR